MVEYQVFLEVLELDHLVEEEEITYNQYPLQRTLLQEILIVRILPNLSLQLRTHHNLWLIPKINLNLIPESSPVSSESLSLHFLSNSYLVSLRLNFYFTFLIIHTLAIYLIHQPLLIQVIVLFHLFKYPSCLKSMKICPLLELGMPLVLKEIGKIKSENFLDGWIP